jgi:diadenosine tetraphosphate (Ap4A) HIT family hydrolase
MGSLRTKEMYDRYKKFVVEHPTNTCVLYAKEAITDFHFWKIVTNDFPYDFIADTHHILVSKQHVKESEITQEEWTEYYSIKSEYLQQNYEFFIETQQVKQGIPEHFHIHLITSKNRF